MEKTIEEVCVNARRLGRVNYLSTTGQVACSMEFEDETMFVEEIKECVEYGVPITISLYRDKDGNTMSTSFLNDLCSMPCGLEEIDEPANLCG